MEDLTNQSAEQQSVDSPQTGEQNPAQVFQQKLYELIAGSGALNYTQIVGILELTKLEIVNRLFAGDFKAKV